MKRDKVIEPLILGLRHYQGQIFNNEKGKSIEFFIPICHLHNEIVILANLTPIN